MVGGLRLMMVDVLFKTREGEGVVIWVGLLWDGLVIEVGGREGWSL